MRRFEHYLLVCCVLLNTNPLLLGLSPSPLTHSIDESPQKFLPQMTDATNNFDHLQGSGPDDATAEGPVIAARPGTELSARSFADCAHHQSCLPDILLKLRI